MKLLLSVLLAFTLINSKAQSNEIPFGDTALVHLDGTVQLILGSHYLIDKSGNGRNFLITGYDFSYLSNTYKGFPYKSLATISAPAGDAELIAADVNNYLYNSSGTPNQIPVTALYNDIDYAHKIFIRHDTRVANVFGNEVYEPLVSDIAVYPFAMAGTDLLKCLDFYNVPTEDASAIWLKPTGNDVSGDGSKSNPYRSIPKIVATTAATVYLMTGNYDITTALTFSGATALKLQGVGAVTFRTASTATGSTINRSLTIANCEIRDTSSTNGFVITADATFQNCRIDKKRGSYFAYGNSAGKNVAIHNCTITSTFTGTSLVRNNAALASISLIGNYGKIVIAYNAANTVTSSTLQYNKGLTGSACTMYTASLLYKDNKSLGNSVFTGLSSRVALENETVNFPISFSDSTFVNNCNFSATVSGKFDSVLNSTFRYGITNFTVKPAQHVRGCRFYGGTDSVVLYMRALANSNITGVVVDSNWIYGNRNSNYLFYFGETAAEAGVNAINGATITRNLIYNERVGTATGLCHTVFIGGGVNNIFKYNYVKMNNGYGVVLKAGGLRYTTVVPHIAYNIFENTGTCSYAVLVKGADSVIAANNTVTNFSNLTAFSVNDDGAGLANSLLVINNLVTLGANTTSFATGTNITSRNNYINTNGYTCFIGGSDFTTSTTISNTGVPANRINGGETTIANIGLASINSIPLNVNLNIQDSTWQVGAIIY